jgi:hypothetical protein
MDSQQEIELLMHVAAGTDPLTALAALPRDVEQTETPSEPSTKSSGGWIALAALIAVTILLLLR